MKSIDVFPTKIYEYNIEEVDAFNLLNEILRNEDKIKTISFVRQTQSVKNYVTDYPYEKDSEFLKLDNLQKIFDSIRNEFEKYNAKFNVLRQWTSIYYNVGFHEPHIHKSNILSNVNYSGIIYLSDLGGTSFFSNSPSSFDNEYYFKSKMGKVLIFPSTIPHYVEPTLDSENKRVTIAFNCEIISSG